MHLDLKKVGRGDTHLWSPQAPSAVSYRPPGTGCSNESKVVEFCTLFTDSDLISAEERNPKSTFSMAEATGCEIFILPCKCTSVGANFGECPIFRLHCHILNRFLLILEKKFGGIDLGSIS